MCWTYIYQYAEGFGMDSVTTGYYQMVAFVLFAIGRAVGTYLLRFINSGKLLMSFALLAMLFVSGTILINGVIGLYCLVAVSFFLSLMFPTIYGIALGNLRVEYLKNYLIVFLVHLVNQFGIPIMSYMNFIEIVSFFA